MKEDLKKCIAEVEAEMGDLEGIIVMVIDDKRQYNYIVGKVQKMFTQLAVENDEFRNVMLEALKMVEVKKKLKDLIDTMKEADIISGDEEILKELES